MKKMSLGFLCILMGATIMVSCKKETVVSKTDVVNVEVEVDSTLPENKTRSKMVNDTTKNMFSKYSLIDLLKMYGDTVTKSTAPFSTKAIYGEIVDRHEINSDDYAKYRDDFWNQKPTYIQPLDNEELNNKLNNASNTDYMLFTFSKEKVATDFNYQLVKTHVFNSYVSCFPAVLLKQMIADPYYDRITVGKGVKYLKTPPYSLPPGNYSVAMLKYFDKKGNVQYFDIVEDPSVSPN